MNVIISAKQMGKKHALLEKQVIDIDDIGTRPAVRTLITAIVKQQVIAYNSKTPEKNLLPFLSREEIDGQAAGGKIGFGSICNEQKADVSKAQETALQAFEDGMFAIFADEKELSQLSETFDLSPQTVITFIRLTFLAGSYW